MYCTCKMTAAAVSSLAVKKVNLKYFMIACSTCVWKGSWRWNMVQIRAISNPRKYTIGASSSTLEIKMRRVGLDATNSPNVNPREGETNRLPNVEKAPETGYMADISALSYSQPRRIARKFEILTM